MIKSISYAPPYSLIRVDDLTVGEMPEFDGKQLIQFTESCITIGCLSETDGETYITLGDINDVKTTDEPIFRGRLQTPSYHILIRSIEMQTILESRVPRTESIVYIWANDAAEPDQIIVGFE